MPIKNIRHKHTFTFLLILRMEKAVQLLKKEKEQSVYEIALQTGFGNNPQYFSTVFKKYYGKTPKEYAQTREPQN